jgi:hypothetical protein
MTRTDFINFLKQANPNHIELLYAYHKEHASKVLTPAQFSMKLQYFESLEVEYSLGGMFLKEKAIEFSGVYNKIKRHYLEKFDVSVLYDKEGRFIKYVY